MKRQAILIVGPAWSGSSILNTLLNTQPGVIGLGEACHWRQPEPTGWCSNCRVAGADCQLYPKIDKQRMLGSALDAYPGKHTVVDGSKHWSRLVTNQETPEWEIERRLILLHKTPHAWTYSAMRHTKWGYEKCFEEWLQQAKYNFNCIAKSREAVQWTPKAHRGFLRLAPDAVMPIGYEDMMRDPFRTLRTICDFSNIEFDYDAAQHWGRTDTCIIGGNNAVYAQFEAKSSFWQKAPEYLDGKYEGRHGQLFLDEQWRTDAELREKVPELYKKYEDRLRWAFGVLNMPSWEEMLADATRDAS
jgi:LPS sulfotransferase NodH